MSEDETRKGSILSRKKKTILISDQEIIMFLRAYIIHPCSWDKVIQSIKENRHTLPEDAKLLYETSSLKKLKDRLSTKLGKMIVAPEKIQNETVRTELRKVLEIEKSLRQSSCTQSKEMTQEETNEKAQEEAPEKPPQGEKRQRQEDLRDEVAGSLPSEGEESQPGPSTKKAKKGKKKGMSVHELVKQNQLEYNKFLTKKIPKLLRALGVSSSSDSE